MFNMNLLDEEKIFSVLISGNIDQDHIDKFIMDLKATINNIDTKDYNLVVEARDVEVSSIKSMISLSQIMSIYKKTDFKRIFALVNDDLKSMKQADMIRRLVGKDIIEANTLKEVKYIIGTM